MVPDRRGLASDSGGQALCSCLCGVVPDRRRTSTELIGSLSLWFPAKARGFVGGDANQRQPNLFRNTTAIYPYYNNPGWNLVTGMADDAIEYMRRITAINPDQAFFVYYVPGAG